MSLFKASLFSVLVLGLACTAQSNSADLNRRIDHQLRAAYSIPPSVKLDIGPAKPSDIAGYQSVTVTLSRGDHKQTKEFLLSKDSKSLMALTKMDLTKDPYAEAMASIDTTGRPFRGNKDAKVVIVNYDDFQCPFCARMHQTLFGDVMKSYGDRVKIVYKDYPLVSIHPWATRAAVDSHCLAAQSNDAYWAFADYVHANAPQISGERGRPLSEQLAAVDSIATDQGRKLNLDMNKLSACLKAQPDEAVKSSMEEAEKLGVNATPTLFINGAKVDGALPASELRAIVDRALQEAGESAPTTSSQK
ncbi:MAG: DsbA family protein [Terriglobales bacterium]